MKRLGEYFTTGTFYIGVVLVSALLLIWLFSWFGEPTNIKEFIGYVTYIFFVSVMFGYVISLIRRFIKWLNERGER